MFVLVGVDVGFLTKGLGGKKISVFGRGRCWFMRTTWEAKTISKTYLYVMILKIASFNCQCGLVILFTKARLRLTRQ